MVVQEEARSFMHELIGKRLVALMCEADILEFIFEDELILHAMGLSRVICGGDILVTTLDYQSWDERDDTHNDEWVNVRRFRSRVEGGVVLSAEINDLYDLRIELDNGILIECLIANAYHHYDEEYEQWMFFEHTENHTGRFLTAYNKQLDFDKVEPIKRP